MTKKKKLLREIVWFICSFLAGIILSLFLFDLINVAINMWVMVVGVTVIMLAVYVVRLTLWIFNENM